jgi:hypothetical protein
MIMGSIIKQPAETFVRYMDFVRRLQKDASGAIIETISTPTVTSKDKTTGTDTTTAMITGVAVNGTKVDARWKAGGTSGAEHIVQYRAATSLGNTYEDEILMRVRED